MDVALLNDIEIPRPGSSSPRLTSSVESESPPLTCTMEPSDDDGELNRPNENAVFVSCTGSPPPMEQVQVPTPESRDEEEGGEEEEEEGVRMNEDDRDDDDLENDPMCQVMNILNFSVVQRRPNSSLFETPLPSGDLMSKAQHIEEKQTLLELLKGRNREMIKAQVEKRIAEIKAQGVERKMKHMIKIVAELHGLYGQFVQSLVVLLANGQSLQDEANEEDSTVLTVGPFKNAQDKDKLVSVMGGLSNQLNTEFESLSKTKRVLRETIQFICEQTDMEMPVWTSSISARFATPQENFNANEPGCSTAPPNDVLTLDMWEEEEELGDVDQNDSGLPAFDEEDSSAGFELVADSERAPTTDSFYAEANVFDDGTLQLPVSPGEDEYASSSTMDDSASVEDDFTASGTVDDSASVENDFTVSGTMDDSASVEDDFTVSGTMDNSASVQDDFTVSGTIDDSASVEDDFTESGTTDDSASEDQVQSVDTIENGEDNFSAFIPVPDPQQPTTSEGRTFYSLVEYPRQPTSCQRRHGWDKGKLKNDKQWMCLCGEIFPTMTLLKYHIRYFNAKWKFMCSLCQRKYPGFNFLKLHMLRTHKILYVGTNACQHCSKKCDTASDLLQHIKDEHNQKLPSEVVQLAQSPGLPPTSVQASDSDDTLISPIIPTPDPYGPQANDTLNSPIIPTPDPYGPQANDALNSPIIPTPDPFGPQANDTMTASSSASLLSPVSDPDALGSFLIVHGSRCACGTELGSKEGLFAHLREEVAIHGNSFHCGLCMANFNHPCGLKGHFFNKHEMPYQDYQERQFGCSFCEIMLGSYEELEFHIREEHQVDDIAEAEQKQDTPCFTISDDDDDDYNIDTDTPFTDTDEVATSAVSENALTPQYASAEVEPNDETSPELFQLLTAGSVDLTEDE